MTDAVTFWDKVAPKYAKDPISDVASYEYTLDRTASYLSPDNRVLELGSKTGCLSDKSFGFKRHPIKLILPLMRLIGKVPYVRFFRSEELEAAITFAGFEIIESGNFPATSRYIVAKRV